MSYSVIHMQKMKMGAMKGIENHNERLKESQTNRDIDGGRTHLNYDLHRADDKRTYYMRVKDRISELNMPKAMRKDAVASVGFITTSDKAFFDRLSPDQTKKFFQASYDFLKDRYGERNVISSKVHLDERTPHMHTYVVPVTSDGRLSAKSIFTPAELKNLQSEYNKHMKANGFNLEKGENTRNHIEMAEFKKQTAYKELDQVESRVTDLKAREESITNQIDELEREREGIREGLKSLKNDFERVKDIRVGFDTVNAIEGKYGLLNRKSIKVNADEFEKLKDIAKKQYVLEDKVERLERDNGRLSQVSDAYSNQSRDIQQKNRQWDQESKKLNKELGTVEKYLTETNQVEQFQKFREEQEQMRKAMQNQVSNEWSR